MFQDGGFVLLSVLPPTDSVPQSLRRSYARLLEAGVLKPCAYRVNHLGISAVAHDLLGTFVPCKFPAHEK